MSINRRRLAPKKSLRDYLHVVFGTVIGRGIAFLNSILIARVLGPEQFGIFAFFFAVMMLTWIILGSFDTTYLRHAKAAQHDTDRQKYLSSNLIIKTGLGFLGFGAVAVAGKSIPAALFGKDYAYHLLLTGIGAGLFLNYVMTQATLYREKDQFKLFAVVTNIHTILVFMILAALWFRSRQFSFDAVIGAYMLSAAAAGAVSLIMIWKTGKPCLPGMGLFKSYLTWGKWMFLLALVFALFERMDFFFLTRHLEPVDIGIYAAGAQLVLIISVTTGALTNVFVPKAVVALKSRAALKSYIRESIAPVFMILAIITVLIVSAPLLVAGLYGPRFEAAVIVIRILALGWLGAAIYLPFSFIFYALDEPHTRFYLELIKLVLGFLFLVVLVPRYGTTGAAIAMTLALWINALVSGLVLREKLQRPDLYEEKDCMGKPSFATKEGS